MAEEIAGAARPAITAEPSQRGVGWLGTLAVGAALTSALVTFLIFGGLTPLLPTHDVLIGVFLVNGVLVLALLAVVARETRRLLKARRAGAAAAGLHARIVGLFSLIAAAPAALVAVVATVTLERGLDPWFTGALKDLMSNTVGIARAYQASQCQALARETQLMAADLNRARVLFDADRKIFRDFMSSRAAFLGFPVALLVEADGTVVERVDQKPLDSFANPSAADLEEANETDALCLIPREGNVLRSALKLQAHQGRILFVGRAGDPRANQFPTIAEAGVAYYQILEQKKFGIQVAFASMFTLVALIVLFSAVWFGLTFANRLVAPIRRLINATDQVATGNFYAQVPVRRTEGDLAHLGETFNKMTAELRRQHDGLTSASQVLDRRRRFTEAVLAGVSAGVLGVDGAGAITIVNPSAEALLGARREALLGRPIEEVMPELSPLLEEVRGARHRLVQQQIETHRGGRDRTLNVRVTSEQESGADQGIVVTLDDITDLIAAQRTSAWADVARRIAHEIKNPLTPIQLSAERIRRKYGKVITTDREIFEQCTDTIVRQVDDIKRMVDEFSSFARMPKPTIDHEDFVATVRQTVFMMRIAHPEIDFTESLPDAPVIVPFDRRLLSQAFTNITKNAIEAIAAVPDSVRGRGHLAVAVYTTSTGYVVCEVIDNGKGFPVEGRHKLLEPYMTTREGGTGLGLAIVSKIFEDHDGGIALEDNPSGRGGRVRMWIPMTPSEAAPGPSRTLARAAS